MKTTKLFAAMLAIAGMGALASCSNDEPVQGGTTGNDAAADNYIRVQLVNPTEVGSRAAADGDIYDPGSDAERNLSSVAFYFFYADGTPFMMDNNNIVGGYTTPNMVKPVVPANSNNGLAATLVLGKAVGEGWKGTVPSKMVAIANLTNPEDYNLYINKTLDELHGMVIDAKAQGPTKGKFVMTTASYGEKVNETTYNEIFWNDIKPENIGTTPEKALENPVVIALERLTAKVQVNLQAADDKYITLADGTILFKVENRPLLDADGKQQQKQFYAKIEAWELNGTAVSGYLFKNINGSTVPFANWNRPAEKRCFWADSYADTELNIAFNWAETLDNKLGTSAYCYENTLDPANEKIQNAKSKATKVLLKARITDEDGAEQNMVSWAGTLYTIKDFKQLVGNFFGSEETEEELDAAVEFKREINDKRHIVSTYYHNVKVPEFDNIRVWLKGACYYIINVRHAVNAAGKNVYGIVRNHKYVVNVNAITGLGTPGGPGDHPEGPENPDPELESFVAAQIDILDWHVVEWDVNVES